jgi:hypothetical protein
MKKPQRGTLYLTDGRVILLKPKDEKEFTLEELQKAVGGLIETVKPLDNGVKLWANEEGFILNLPRNPHSQSLVNLHWHGLPYLVGNLISTYRVTPESTLGDGDSRMTVESLEL